MEVYIKQTCNGCDGSGMKISGYYSATTAPIIKPCSLCGGHGFILIPSVVSDDVVIGEKFFTTEEKE